MQVAKEQLSRTSVVNLHANILRNIVFDAKIALGDALVIHGRTAQHMLKQFIRLIYSSEHAFAHANPALNSPNCNIGHRRVSSLQRQSMGWGGSRNRRHYERIGAPKRGCFDQGVVLKKTESRGFRAFHGFRGSSKYWNFYGIEKGVIFKCSSCPSRGFRGSRGFEGEKRTTPFLNNPLPALRSFKGDCSESSLSRRIGSVESLSRNPE